MHHDRLQVSLFFLVVFILLLLGWLASSSVQTGSYALILEEGREIPNKQPVFGVGKNRIMQQVGEGRPCGRKAFLLQEGTCRLWAECPQGYTCKGPNKGKSPDRMTAYCTCQRAAS